MTAVKQSSFWLLGIASGAIAIHLTLTSRANDSSLWGNSFLFWIAVISLLWSKRHTLNLNSGWLSSFWGAVLLTIVLLKSLSVSGYDPFLRIFPLISCFSVALLASGFKGLKQYWRELLIVCFIAPSPGALAILIDISTITAKFSTAILWYLGFSVSRNGVIITLPKAAVEVYPGCSGIESVVYLLGLSVVFLMMFPITGTKKFLVPVVAVLTAFIVNGFRVALMAVLAASPPSLEYWHKGEGSLVFSTIAVFILGLFCYFILEQENTEDNESEELEE